MEKMKKILFASVAFILPAVAAAQTTSDSPITSITDVQNTLTNWVTYLFTIFWIISVGMLIWAAILFVTAGGDDTKISKAKKIILYAVVAAAVALLANGVQSIVTNVLKGGQ